MASPLVPLSEASYRAWGVAFALIGVLAFSFRPILIKLSYAAHPVTPTTLLFLRMMLALPFFAAIAWWLRGQQPRLGARDWAGVVALGFIGYYAASFLDFIGLQYVGAGVGRLVLFLYPTLVLLLSFLFLAKPASRREVLALVLSYAGIALVLSNQVDATPEGRLFVLGVLLVFASAPAAAQFLVLEPVFALELLAAVWWYAAIMATFSTVLPVFLQAEALKRIGANRFALIGAVGPVSVALTSALGLDEPFTWRQAAGGLLVIAGVLLATLRSRS